MLYVIEGMLAILVLIGSMTITWGARRFQFPNRFLAVTFAVTAASWLAFLIATISMMVITLMLSNA